MPPDVRSYFRTMKKTDQKERAKIITSLVTETDLEGEALVQAYKQRISEQGVKALAEAEVTEGSDFIGYGRSTFKNKNKQTHVFGFC